MPARRRGHSPDPIRDRLRSARLRLGLTFQQVALRAGLRSAAYVFHIENGHKIPTRDVAARLAGALNQDESLFAAWAQALQRSDLRSVLDATEILLADPELAAFAAGEWTRELGSNAPVRARDPVHIDPGDSATPHVWPRASVDRGSDPRRAAMRLRIPVIAAGADPGDGLRPACELRRTLSLDVFSLGPPEALARPFAYVLDAASIRRVPDLGMGRVAVISRAPGPIERRRVYAVRTDSGVELARVLWNGRSLLLLPAPGRTDFAVLEAEGEDGLRQRVVGFVARVFAAEVAAE